MRFRLLPVYSREGRARPAKVASGWNNKSAREREAPGNGSQSTPLGPPRDMPERFADDDGVAHALESDDGAAPVVLGDRYHRARRLGLLHDRVNDAEGTREVLAGDAQVENLEPVGAHGARERPVTPVGAADDAALRSAPAPGSAGPAQGGAT